MASPLQEAGLVDALQVRDVSLLWRAVIALTIGYSAFISEVFRAGIQAVEPGQIEAAKALGLSRSQRFRLIVMPQAIRTILPPLGNDFVAMVKDSSLVSVLGVADITQMGKVYAAGLVPLLRDLFDRRLYLSRAHGQPVAGAAGAGEPHAQRTRAMTAGDGAGTGLCGQDAGGAGRRLCRLVERLRPRDRGISAIACPSSSPPGSRATCHPAPVRSSMRAVAPACRVPICGPSDTTSSRGWTCRMRCWRWPDSAAAIARWSKARLGDTLPWQDGHFRAVMSTGVFTEGHAPAGGLFELARITRPGGHVVFTVRDSILDIRRFSHRLRHDSIGPAPGRRSRRARRFAPLPSPSRRFWCGPSSSPFVSREPRSRAAHLHRTKRRSHGTAGGVPKARHRRSPLMGVWCSAPPKGPQGRRPSARTNIRRSRDR